MDPSLLVLSVSVQDQCSNPKILDKGISWTVDPQLVTYVVTPDSKNLTFKSFDSSVKSISVTVTLSYTKIGDSKGTVYTISDS